MVCRVAKAVVEADKLKTGWIFVSPDQCSGELEGIGPPSGDGSKVLGLLFSRTSLPGKTSVQTSSSCIRTSRA